jgi:choice-of-anchor B domain-containing protein
MRKLIFILLLSGMTCAATAQLNMTLKSQKTYTTTIASLWGWHDGAGKEYALVGAYNGLSIVDVTNPFSPVELQFITTQPSNWHEIKTWQHYAYVVNESGGGMLIVDLSGLPGTVSYVYDYFGGYIPDSTGHYFHTAHTVTIDEFGYMWLNGQGGGGAFVFNLNTDPMNPELVGLPIHYNMIYIHDCYVRNNIMYTADIYNGDVRILDVTDKANPVLLAIEGTPWNFTHNTWLSDNSQVLYTTDEVSGSYVVAYDISNLGNITELDRFTSLPGTGSVPHNVHVKNDYLVIAHYRDGVVIADANRPSNLIKVGNYDTYSLGAGSGFNGCWGVYPYLPSGNILASDITNGLFVLGVNYTRASYLEGVVSDSVSGNPLNGVTVTIASAPGAQIATSALNGTYGTGAAGSGSYTVTYSKAGYVSKSLIVSLSAGNVTTLNVSMNLIPVCGTPTGLFASNITNNAAKLNWNNMSATSYLVSWKKVGSGGTSTTTTTGTFHNIAGLQSCKTYQFNVRATCLGGSQFTSPWTNFSTTGRSCRIMANGEIELLNKEPIAYPSPFDESFTVEISLLQEEPSVIELIDMTGKRCVRVFSGMLPSGDHFKQVDSANLPAGIYELRMLIGDEVYHKMITKE